MGSSGHRDLSSRPSSDRHLGLYLGKSGTRWRVARVLVMMAKSQHR
jgi:hypothetical protein